MNAMVNNIRCWHRRVFFSILVRTGGGTRKKDTVRRTILGLYQVYSKGWGLLRAKNRAGICRREWFFYLTTDEARKDLVLRTHMNTSGFLN